MPPATAVANNATSGGGASSRVPQLENFRMASAFAEYLEQMRRMFRDGAMSLDMAAVGLEKALRDEGRGDSGERRRRAKRLARQLKLAAFASHTAARLVTRAWAIFEAEYEDMINPRASRQGFDFRG